MKILIAGFLLLGFFAIPNKINHVFPVGSILNKAKDDSLHVSKYLPLLKAAPCVEKLLSAVQKSNVTQYNPRLSFYGIYLNNRKKYRYLEVYIDKWNDTKDTSYVGALKIGNMMFLCTGDIKNTDLFHKTTSNKFHVRLRIARTGPKSPYVAVPTEPSLQGTFNICKGVPLYVEVFTVNPISGYKMNVENK